VTPATVVAHGSVYPGRDYVLFKVNGYSNLPTWPPARPADGQTAASGHQEEAVQ
jgi:hypothetical protein